MTKILLMEVKDNGKMRKILLALFACIIIMTATVTAAPLPSQVKVGNSVVKMGDKVEKAITAFGRPWHIAANANYYWRDSVNLYSPEVVVKTYSGSQKIYALIVDRVPTINTPENIGVGSVKDDVIKAYGQGKERKLSNGDTVLSYGKDEALEPYLRFRIDAKTNTVYYYVLGKPDKPKHKRR